MSERFEEYLDRFCETYKTKKDKAEELHVVQDVKEYYEADDIGKIRE